jgi:uncharacterized protein
MKQGWIACWALAVASCSLEGSSFEHLQAEPPRDSSAAAKASDAELDSFVKRVVQDADSIWAFDFKRRNKPYVAARMVGVSSTAPNPCAGLLLPSTDPQCQDAQPVFIDLDFQRALQDRFGKDAAAPQSYAIAHAMGHHVQRVLGLDRKVVQVLGGRPSASHAVELQLELQADCLAGVWTRVTKSTGTLERDQVEEALRQASEVGTERKLDDKPGLETFTYAIPRRRLYWFSKGFNTTRVEECDTFESE